MKNLHLPILLILAIFLAGSCSDDSNEPEMEEDQFGTGLFSDENLIDEIFFVSFPQEMSQVQDPCAITAIGLVNTANAFFGFRGFFFPTFAGGERSTDPIMSLSGHSNYRVYNWSPDGGDSNVTLQFSETSDKNFQLIFVQEDGGPLLRFIESSENKDGNEGELKIYGGNENQTLISTYTWKVFPDKSREIVLTEPERSDFFIKVEGNTDLSGSVEFQDDGQNSKTIQWDAAGNGSWQEFDENDNLVDQGSWTVP